MTVEQPMPLQPRDRWPTHLEESLKQFFSPAEAIQDFFTEDEHNEISMHMFHTFTKMRHYKGGTFKFENFDEKLVWKLIYPKLKQKFDWLREDDLLSGNGYITATNYALHMDSCNPTTYFKYNQLAIKSFLIPIFVCQPDGIDRDSNFVIFKDRLFGWECNFSNGSSNNVQLAYQQNVTSYSDLPWVDINGNPALVDDTKMLISEEIYKNHLSHLPRETCHGLEIESILPYKPRSIVIFDPYQPHATGNKDWSKTRLKGGIRFNIQRRIENL